MCKFLAMQLLPDIKTPHQFLLFLFRHDECSRGIRHGNGREQAPHGHSTLHAQAQAGFPLDTFQQGKHTLQPVFRCIGPDLQLPAAFHGNQGGIDFADGLGYALLGIDHRTY
ncbi:hypothetical protein NXW17_11385 [Bacteroides fragilis]|nr:MULTISPECIES: hypothetical protein [Bacteroides]MCS2266467.1 hypothetical protein [Bacteroides fragilis]WJE94799.1 hypothetical protein PTOS_002235 [Bacteroides fragilis]